MIFSSRFVFQILQSWSNYNHVLLAILVHWWRAGLCLWSPKTCCCELCQASQQWLHSSLHCPLQEGSSWQSGNWKAEENENVLWRARVGNYCTFCFYILISSHLRQVQNKISTVLEKLSKQNLLTKDLNETISNARDLEEVELHVSNLSFNNSIYYCFTFTVCSIKRKQEENLGSQGKRTGTRRGCFVLSKQFQGNQTGKVGEQRKTRTGNCWSCWTGHQAHPCRCDCKGHGKLARFWIFVR